MFELDRQVVYCCEGCRRNDHGTCSVWLSPVARFRGRNDCGLSTHISKRKIIADEPKRVGQQKQKRKTKGKTAK
jgi:hypothetical protein